jgi:cyclopropane fatty-acyl-phospholipid synthase-like methyltransferase
MLRYRVGATLDADTFWSVGQQTAEKLISALREAGKCVEDFSVILDFGCGCGRTLIWLVRQFPRQHFLGRDVDREAIEWCAANLPSADFSVNDRSPPLECRSMSIDFVYAISVFTHLDEELQRTWLSELYRILTPGGLVYSHFMGAKFGNHCPASM